MSAGATAVAEGPSIRRVLGWSLVIALCVAAATACVAILTGSFDDTDARVIGTSLGFAVFSSTAAAGAGARLHAQGPTRVVGVVTVIASVLAFALLVAAIWGDNGSDTGEAFWRPWGCAAITALAGSHASLVLRARRREDSGTLGLLVGVSLITGGLDWFLGFLPIAGIGDGAVDGGYAQFLAVLTILLVLSTGLQPIIRRLERQRPDPGLAARGFPQHGTASTPRQHLAAEVMASADRIDALAGAPEVTRECARLRELARSLAD